MKTYCEVIISIIKKIHNSLNFLREFTINIIFLIIIGAICLCITNQIRHKKYFSINKFQDSYFLQFPKLKQNLSQCNNKKYFIKKIIPFFKKKMFNTFNDSIYKINQEIKNKKKIQNIEKIILNIKKLLLIKEKCLQIFKKILEKKMQYQNKKKYKNIIKEKNVLFYTIFDNKNFLNTINNILKKNYKLEKINSKKYSNKINVYEYIFEKSPNNMIVLLFFKYNTIHPTNNINKLKSLHSISKIKNLIEHKKINQNFSKLIRNKILEKKVNNNKYHIHIKKHSQQKKSLNKSKNKKILENEINYKKFLLKLIINLIQDQKIKEKNFFSKIFLDLIKLEIQKIIECFDKSKKKFLISLEKIKETLKILLQIHQIKNNKIKNKVDRCFKNINDDFTKTQKNPKEKEVKHYDWVIYKNMVCSMDR